jgi:hypothetical protein
MGLFLNSIKLKKKNLQTKLLKIMHANILAFSP